MQLYAADSTMQTTYPSVNAQPSTIPMNLQPTAPITMQPAMTVQPIATQSRSVVTTTNVVQQSGPNGKNLWTSGICQYALEFRSCLCAAFLPCIFSMLLSQRMGERACVPCCIVSSTPLLRSVFRTKHNIHGDICDDCIVSNCCSPCVLCQLSREMDYKGYPMDSCML